MAVRLLHIVEAKYSEPFREDLTVDIVLEFAKSYYINDVGEVILCGLTPDVFNPTLKPLDISHLVRIYGD